MSEALNELIVIPKETALEVFTTEGSIDPHLEKIKAAVTGIVPDLSTKKGRDAVASLAFKVTKSKTYLESVGKALADEQKEIPKKIDATRKRARDFLDNLAAEVRKPLTDWENAEKARVDGLKQRLAFFDTVCQGLEDLPSSEISDRMHQVTSTEMGETWQEFASYAEQAKMGAERTLAAAFQKRQQYEDEQAELARLRAEKEERDRRDREEQIAREAAERAQREAEQRQQAERDEAARKVREAEEATQRAEQERLEAEERAARAEREAQERAERAAEQERQRIADEQRQAEEAARAREADREHRKAINTAALEAFVKEGIDKETAIQVITLIAQRKIPAVAITY